MRNLFFINLLLAILITISCQNASSNQTDVESPAASKPAVDGTATLATEAAETAELAAETVETTLGQPASEANNKKEKKAANSTKKTGKTVAVEEVILPPTILPTDKPIASPVEIIPQPKPVAEQPKTQPAEAAGPPSHDAWDKLLQQYVTADGKVNYSGLKKDKAKLEAYLKTLENNPPQDGWSRGEKMAFWINAYNAATVKLIVDNYPVSSITKLDGGKPWDVKRVKIGSKAYSLDAIENDILRPQFKDARIHFAVNCAAQSCPPLLNRAWTAANLESNFEKQAKAFINNSKFNKISAKSVQVSKIFDWYGSDFGNLVTYLNKYATTKINAGAKVEFLEYDWALNQQ